MPPVSIGSRMPGGTTARVMVGALLVLWFALPMVPVALWAVAGEWRAPAVLPQSYSWRGWSQAASSGLMPALLASTLLGGAVAVIATPLGFMAASSLRRLPPRSQRIVEAVLLSPLAIPPFALVMGMNVVLLRAYIPAAAGVLLLLVVTALPYTVFMFRSALAGYDDRFEEAARTLGASRAQTVRHVRIPLLAKASARAAFLAFLVGWGDYLVTLIVGGGQLRTLPLILASAASGSGNQQLTAILSLAVVLPPLVLLVLLLSGRPGRTR
ncbi:ABC transporter permease subunit [Arthrobacter roseus]|uniref:ABC transporter permease subunit n=1 Tax=Arthrobacter roseus TaxID=136274 RepID=UPI001964A927|nr:putative spermidine/putrescine transport system permease protein [Arthrobacter roseus]